jgi:two-component system sensor histidine kinase MtrB
MTAGGGSDTRPVEATVGRPATAAQPTPPPDFTLPGLPMAGLPVPGLPVLVEPPGPADPPRVADGSPIEPAAGVPSRGLRSAQRLGTLGLGLRQAVLFWSRSLRLRVIVLTLLFSTLVMVGVGLVVQQQIVTGLLQSKTDAAIGEIEAARVKAQQSLQGAETDPTSLTTALNTALSELGRTTDTGGSQGSTAGVFDPVIIPAHNPELAVPANRVGDVPADLQEAVAAGNLASQYTTVERDGQSIPALVVGAPATTDAGSFGVYLIFLLAGEQSTMTVVQNTLLLGGAALALALTLIASLVAAQVARPVRRAAAVAQRFAAGSLDERMPVKGAVELTSLATSFNGMAEAIRAQIRQLEEFGRLQRRFTSDVSHELRTPVTTVRMAADVLHEERSEFPPHLARATELLVAELDRFEDLLADLLEISRHDAGMAELSAETIDVRATITGCVAASAPLAETAGVAIRTQLPDAPVVAEIDARRVVRILRNLLNNAIDHAEGSDIEVALGVGDDALAITVTDHGVGLKPGEAGLVFNRFWRADPSRQRRSGGTGLGLAISLEDARLHGGWLQASGAPGKGARFRLTLPLRRGILVTSSPLPLAVDEADDGADDEHRGVT